MDLTPVPMLVEQTDIARRGETITRATDNEQPIGAHFRRIGQRDADACPQQGFNPFL